MNQILKNNYNKKYISFDIFDTLLYRKCNENEIFEKMEEKLNKSFDHFKEKRIKAQIEAQSEKKVESTIEDIYDMFITNKDEIKELIDKEVETEIENLEPNLLLIQKINDLSADGKKIVIISDMYLLKDNIANILKHFNINYDYLYVSSDIQLRKSNGKLFDYVLKDLKIKNTEIIHTGDNLKSDYLMPKIKGIEAYRWKKITTTENHVDVLKKSKSDNSNVLIKIIEQYIPLDYFDEIGYKLFGPLLYGYSKWINELCKKIKLDYLCFLSRDGQIMEKAYKIIYPEEKNYNYFLASRRALTVPRLVDAKNMNDIIRYVPYIKREESVENFLSKIGIYDKQLINKIKNKYGDTLSRNTLLSDDIGKDIFNMIKDEMYQNAIKERENALGYINENMPEGKVGIIDIGWYGTMQRTLDNLLENESKSREFYGIYLGLLKKENEKNLKNANGYIFNYEDGIENSKLLYGYNGLIELMFTADHGSAKRYIKEDNKYKCELEEEKGEYTEFVKKVQNGALKFILDAKRENLDLTSKEAFQPINDLLTNPSLEECYILGDLNFYDAYFEKIIQFHGWKEFIKKPKSEIKKFLKSNWKIGYIKEMFKVSKPSKIYNILNKIK